jgi:ankyrin repeat protein
MFFLFIISGCAELMGNRRVDYTPLIRGDFDARTQPAKISIEASDALLEKGYAKLGVIEVEHVIERCLPEGDKVKCQPVSNVDQHTADLLQEAASRGGDFVTLSKDKQRSKKEIIRQGKCLYWTKNRRYQTVWNQATLQYEWGSVVERQCGQFEKLIGEDSVLTSAGNIWRREPDMAKAQRFSRQFMLAASRGDLDTVKKFVKQGLDVNIRNMDGELVLGVAAGYGQKEVVGYLLQAGADINGTDDIGTPLHWAARKGQTDMVRLLIAKGADVSAKNPNVSDPYNEITPLFYAAAAGSVDIIKLLLENGAKVDEKTTKGVTPLMLAARYSRLEAVKALIKAGADEDAKSDKVVLANSVMQLTPLLFAVVYAHPDTIIALLEKGAEPYKKISDRGETVHDVAAIRPKIYQLVSGYVNGTSGFIDRKGRIIVPMHLLGASPYSEGLAAVKTGPKYGYMDKAGKMVIEPRFYEAKSFSEGLAPVLDLGRWGFINKQGEFVIAPQYIDVGGFSEGLAAVQTAKGKWGYINKKGEFVIRANYDSAGEFSEGLAIVGYGISNTFDMKWQCIDKTGKAITGKYQAMSSFKDGLAEVRIRKKWGYINKKGKIVIKPQFRYAGSFFEGLAQAKTMDEKYGFIDKTGKFVIKPQFSSASDFSEGLAPVGLPKEKITTGKYGYIDKTGKFVIKPRFWTAGTFKEGMAYVEMGERAKKKKWGYVDRTGKIVIKPQFDSAWWFHEGRAEIRNSDRKKWIADWRALQKVKAVSFEMNSGLRSAAQKGDIRAVKSWLKKGADVNAKNDRGISALMLAVLNGRVKTAKFLLDKGAEINARDINGYTPLIHAAADGDIRMVKLLMNSGADLNARNDLDITALAAADLMHHTKVVELLKKAGAQ